MNHLIYCNLLDTEPKHCNNSLEVTFEKAFTIDIWPNLIYGILAEDKAFCSKSISKGDMDENVCIMIIVAKVSTFVKLSGDDNGRYTNIEIRK